MLSETSRLITMALLSLSTLLSSCGPATTAAGAAGLGALLDNLKKQVEEIEEKAIAGADLLQIQAGGKVTLAIDEAKKAYSDSLDKTFAQLSAAQQETFNSLSSIVDQFRAGAAADMSTIEETALAAIHSLPFSKSFPRIYDFSPHYVLPFSATGTPAALQLEGDFHDLPRPKYDAIASLGTKQFTNSAKSSNTCVFEIPTTALTFKDNAITANYVRINIPYQTGVILKKEATTEFDLRLITLPNSPGTAKITITTPTATTIRQQVASPEMFQDSSQDDIKDGGEHADLAIHRWPADSGWRIVPGSVTYHMNGSQGSQGVEKDWWFSRNLSTVNEAVLTFSTEHHRILGTSGKIHFTIQFSEEKEITQSVNADHDVPLKWAESRVITVPSGSTWIGSYNRFDGKIQQFGGPYSDEFINVTTAGPIITILPNPGR